MPNIASKPWCGVIIAADAFIKPSTGVEVVLYKITGRSFLEGGRLKEFHVVLETN